MLAFLAMLERNSASGVGPAARASSGPSAAGRRSRRPRSRSLRWSPGASQRRTSPGACSCPGVPCRPTSRTFSPSSARKAGWRSSARHCARAFPLSRDGYSGSGRFADQRAECPRGRDGRASWEQRSAVVKQHHAVAQQAPPLLGMAGHGSGPEAIRRPRVRTPGPMLAGAVPAAPGGSRRRHWQVCHLGSLDECSRCAGARRGSMAMVLSCLLRTGRLFRPRPAAFPTRQAGARGQYAPFPGAAAGGVESPTAGQAC